MKIEILGTGCTKCDALYALAKETAADLGVAAEIVKITDIREIAKRGIMSPPAIFLDGKLQAAGKLPSKEDITRWIKSLS